MVLATAAGYGEHRQYRNYYRRLKLTHRHYVLLEQLNCLHIDPYQ